MATFYQGMTRLDAVSYKSWNCEEPSFAKSRDTKGTGEDEGDTSTTKKLWINLLNHWFHWHVKEKSIPWLEG